MPLGISSCEEHDDCVVSFISRRCPICEQMKELDRLTNDLECMTDQRNEAQSYADSLADELAKYSRCPAKESKGRLFLAEDQ